VSVKTVEQLQGVAVAKSKGGGNNESENLIRALGKVLPVSEGEKPSIQCPGDNRLVLEFVTELAPILAACGFYQKANRAVMIESVLRKDRLKRERLLESIVELTPASLVTQIEQHCTPFNLRLKEDPSAKKILVQIKKSITAKTASLVLESPAFIRALPIIEECTNLRLPVRSASGIALSRIGYDPESQIFTSHDAPPVDESLSMPEAVKFLRSLLAEFCFHEDDRERCISVAIAAALTLFCTHLLDPLTLRPAFLATANSEGAGKTLLISIAIVARLGYVPAGSAPDYEPEMRKILDSAIRDYSPILFLDNIKGHLNSGELEAALTSTMRRGRLLGSNNQFESENRTTVFITGNNATFSPDLRRRVLAIELFLPEAKPEDRVIRFPLDENRLLSLRPEILSALWALIRSWHQAGEPKAKTEHSTFRSWSLTIGGILEHAGFASPSLPSVIAAGGDTQTRDMEHLVAAMNPAHEYKFAELIELARDNRLFARLIPEEGDMDAPHKQRLSLLIRKYIGRVFSSHLRFDLIGDTRKTERFVVTELEPKQ
jgi:hypothetical protein